MSDLIQDQQDAPGGGAWTPAGLEEALDAVAAVTAEASRHLASIAPQSALFRAAAPALPDRMLHVLGRIDLTVALFARSTAMIGEAAELAAGRRALTASCVDLCTLAQEVAESYRPLARMARRTICVHAPAAAIGLWDRGALRQVLDGLIFHALDDAGHAPIDVRIATDADVCRLAVCSQPRASPDREIDTAGEPFPLAPIRIWTMRQLCRAMGGTLTLATETGQGTTSTVHLPWTIVPPAPNP